MKKTILRSCLNLAKSQHNRDHPAWSSKAVHYTFVIQHNTIIELGVNRPNVKPPRHYGYNPHCDWHSELDAWHKARGLLDDGGWEIVNVKITKEFIPQFRLAAPCEKCTNFLKANGCKRFYFTTDNGKIRSITV